MAHSVCCFLLENADRDATRSEFQSRVVVQCGGDC